MSATFVHSGPKIRVDDSETTRKSHLSSQLSGQNDKAQLAGKNRCQDFGMCIKFCLSTTTDNQYRKLRSSNGAFEKGNRKKTFHIEKKKCSFTKAIHRVIGR